MTKKIILFALCSMLLAPCSSARAQQPEKIARIGFLDGSNPSGSAVLLEAFRQGLSELGGSRERISPSSTGLAERKSEPLPELAADLVRLKVDLIVAAAGRRQRWRPRKRLLLYRS